MKLIYGVGTNDANYSVVVREELPSFGGKRARKLLFYCPFYMTWQNMLRRCYSLDYKNSRPTYKNAECLNEWLLFSKFKLWMECQEWEGRQLDKDILQYGNKLYSPETCVFVRPHTNYFVIGCDRSRGDLPVGVSRHSKSPKYVAQCSNPFNQDSGYLGLFTTPEEAHEAWRKRKHELAQLVAATESDPRVVEALKKRYSVEEWYKNNPISS